MPYIFTLLPSGDDCIVSPITSFEVFDDNGSLTSFHSEEDRLVLSELPTMTPSLTTLTSSSSPTLLQSSSTHLDSHHHQSSFRNFTRFIRQRQARQQEHAAELSLSRESSQCLSHQVNQLKFKFLSFAIIANDGGCYSSAYDSQNLLENDSSVYCSGRTGTVNITLKYCGGKVLMDTTCVLDKVIVRSPREGFTAPCKEGLIFISHKPIDVEKTRQFDRFTKQDYDAYLMSINKLDLVDHNPVAWFNMSNQVEQVISIGQRSGKYILIKLLRSDDEEENIDLEYIGFIGYTGARSFVSASHLL